MAGYFNQEYGTQAATVASGVITITATRPRTVVTVTGEGSAADDLTTITGGIVGQRIILRGATAGHITAKNSPGTGLYLQADFTLTYTQSSLELECTALNTWTEISRAQVTA